MAKAKMADEELRQLKLALRYLAEQWQEQSSLQAQTLLSLLAARIQEPGSWESCEANQGCCPGCRAGCWARNSLALPAAGSR